MLLFDLFKDLMKATTLHLSFQEIAVESTGLGVRLWSRNAAPGIYGSSARGPLLSIPRYLLGFRGLGTVTGKETQEEE